MTTPRIRPNARHLALRAALVAARLRFTVGDRVTRTSAVIVYEVPLGDDVHVASIIAAGAHYEVFVSSMRDGERHRATLITPRDVAFLVGAWARYVRRTNDGGSL